MVKYTRKMRETGPLAARPGADRDTVYSMQFRENMDAYANAARFRDNFGPYNAIGNSGRLARERPVAITGK